MNFCFSFYIFQVYNELSYKDCQLQSYLNYLQTNCVPSEPKVNSVSDQVLYTI